MRKKLLRLARFVPLAAVLAAGVASAQMTGTIIGVVTDASTGKPVAGALVVATSPNLQGEQTAVTDASGSFRFSVLPPGAYKLAVQIEGYKPFDRSDIVLRVDKTLRANMAVVPEAVQMEEQVVRTGIAPVINMGTTETGTVASKEFLASVPLPTVTVQQVAIIAPTATSDLAGVGFAGSQSLENNYVLDGLSVGDPRYGYLGTDLLQHFVEEVDLKTGAFMPEYGRSGAGIVNIVTKSGSNEFHGSVFGDLTPSFLVSPNGPASGRVGKALWWNTKPSEGAYDADFGFELGGPIVKDKLWFYAGFAPVLNRTYFDRYVNANQVDASGNPLKDSSGNYLQTRVPGSDQIYSSALTTYQFTGKLTYLFNEDHNLSLAFSGTPQTNTGVYRDPYGNFARLDMNESRFIGDWSATTYDLVANYTGKLMDKHLIVEGTAGLHRATYDSDPTTVNGVDQGNTDSTLWYPSSIPLSDFENAPSMCSNAGYACPVQRYQTGGYGLMDHHTENRIAAKGALSYLFEALGQHNAKFGLDYERVNDDIVQNLSGADQGGAWYYLGGGTYYTYRNYGTVVNNAYPSTSPLYNYPGIGITNPNPVQGTDFFFSPDHANPVSTSFSVFLQDSWSILSNLTVNYGLRWESQSMSDDLHPSSTSINIDNNFAPRVQVIWDPTNQGRAKISGNWGRFYNMIPVDMGVRSFGAESQVLALYDCSGAAGGAGPGTLGKSTTGFSPVSTGSGCVPIPNAVTNYQNNPVTMAQAGGVSPVSPNIGGIYVDQFGAAAEYEILSDLSVGIEWQARRLGQTIEDMSSNDGNTYFIANPGVSKPFTTSIPSVQQANPLQATTRDAFTGRQFTLQFPQAQRDYDGVTVHVTKNFSKHWLAQLSYTYSVLRGNYSGPIDPEYGGGQIDPYITAAFDLPSLMANQQGLLPGDVTHSFRAYGSYTFDLSPRVSVTTGGALRVMSGTPVSILGAHPLYGPGAAFIVPRGEGGRTPAITNLDLSGKVEWVLSPPYALRVSIDLFNVLNAQNALMLDPNYTFDSVHPIQNATCTNKNSVNTANPIASAQADCSDIKYLKTIDGRPVTVNENFGKPLGGLFQLPFSMRLGVALTF